MKSLPIRAMLETDSCCERDRRVRVTNPCWVSHTEVETKPWWVSHTQEEAPTFKNIYATQTVFNGLLLYLKMQYRSRVVVAHALNPSTQEVEAGGSL